ncbi:MAG: CRISPR-associated endonuclease Cas2 [Desulfobulbaceae bacterium A2]|nr:MAG: CRISPR-associated endonuclease Cas2 [Desulfobulbaceae bacterium A2]
MFYVICFDISDDRVRYRAVKVVKGLGYRVQKSVFEFPHMTEHQLLTLKNKLEALIDHDTDSIRYYRLCRACLTDVEWSGQGAKPQIENFVVL